MYIGMNLRSDRLDDSLEVRTDNRNIDSPPSFKYLGIILQQNMINCHIDYVYRKISRMYGVGKFLRKASTTMMSLFSYSRSVLYGVAK